MDIFLGHILNWIIVNPVLIRTSDNVSVTMRFRVSKITECNSGRCERVAELYPMKLEEKDPLKFLKNIDVGPQTFE